MSRSIPLVLALVASASCAAQSGRVPIPADHQLVLELRKKLANTRTLSANFTQEKRYRFMTGTLRAEGSVHFERPDHLRWQVNDPDDPLIVLMNGKSIRIKQQGREEEVKGVDRKVYASIQQLILGIVDGSMIGSAAMKTSFFTEADRLVVLLEPKDERMARNLHDLRLDFGRSDMILQAMTLTEGDGDSTLLTFRDARLDQPLPTGVFTDF